MQLQIGSEFLSYVRRANLVATYRQRLPDTEFIRIETIHAGMAIHREQEALVNHAPPSSLSKYDAILLDECSQIDNSVARKVTYAIDELPQKPFVAIAADYKQLQPVEPDGSKKKRRSNYQPACSYMARISKRLPTVTLNTIYRTDDPALLDFLNKVREDQPDRDTIFEFFKNRRFRFVGEQSMLDAVKQGICLLYTSPSPRDS